MLRIFAAAALAALTAPAAQAQHCHRPAAAQAVAHVAPTYAPHYTPYHAPYYNPYYAPTYVAPQPLAVYVVPGTPTVALNVYPGQFTVVQGVPVNVNVNVNPAAPPAVPPATR